MEVKSTMIPTENTVMKRDHPKALKKPVAAIPLV
jgi:hypothetical protein